MVNPYGMPRDIKVDDCRYNVDILYVFNLIIANKFIQYSYNTFKYSKKYFKIRSFASPVYKSQNNIIGMCKVHEEVSKPF